MNRLVIIGNGFDLAHGLKTRYEDFIVWYLKKIITNGIKNSPFERKYEDEIISIDWKNISNLEDTVKEFNKIESISEIIDSNRLMKVSNVEFNNISTVIKAIDGSPKIYYAIKDGFINETLENKNWTDVESHYFKRLIKFFENKNIFYVKQENKTFELLKAELILYLREIDKTSNRVAKQLDYILDKFCIDNSIYLMYGERRKVELNDRFENKNLEGVTYINFNYTSTIRQYANKYFKKLEKIIDIHGNVDNDKSIIFGYGDEMTDYYKKLENLDNEIFLKHFKSHYYHSNNKYSHLLFEVENYEFDVVIIGHSLGLSDRLLLNTIFENKNCKAIHLTHTGGDSHFRKRIALSRHFDNKKEYRKKLMEEIDFLKIDRN